MSKEFVVIDPTGKERDWVDPVEEWSVRETKCYWYADNGAYTYRFWKREDWQYLVREMEANPNGTE